MSRRISARRRARTRRLRRREIAATAAILAALLPGCAPEAQRPERIVLIVIDTLRRDHLSTYGAEIETPHIAALAARGTVVPDAVSSFHQTTMSMASLFTGRTPAIESRVAAEPLAWKGPTRFGLARYAGPADGESYLPRSLPTLGEVMRSAGYETIGVVSNFLLFRPAGFDRGFDTWIEVGEIGGRLPRGMPRRAAPLRAGPHVLEQVARALRERRGDHFFLYVHFMEVHDYNLLDRSYAESVIAADRQVGALDDLLEAEGLADGAAIVLTSDHGERLGERHVRKGLPFHTGNPSFEPLLQVPLVVAGAEPPAAVAPRSDDVFRWLATTAGAPPTGAPDLAAGELFVSERFFQTYRRGRWKSYTRRSDGELTLVDLERDPGETRDVADANPRVARHHRERIEMLTAALAADAPGSRESQQLQERLRALGYLE